ncbi:unnamed protein product, partial [Pleuronectes platessa]
MDIAFGAPSYEYQPQMDITLDSPSIQMIETTEDEAPAPLKQLRGRSRSAGGVEVQSLTNLSTSVLQVSAGQTLPARVRKNRDSEGNYQKSGFCLEPVRDVR